MRRPLWFIFLMFALVLAALTTGTSVQAESDFFPGWRSRSWPKAPPAGPLTGWRVVVDPGHGGSDVGACPASSSPCEKELALSISLKLQEALSQAGASVEMTRQDDSAVDIQSRRAYANSRGAHRLLSVHLNSGPSPAQGIETWVDWHAARDAGYAHTAAVWQAYADSIQQRTWESASRYAADARDRGVKYSGHDPPWDSSRIGVIRPAGPAFPDGVRMPAALVELGFLSNPTEFDRLIRDEYQRALAFGMRDGFVEHAARYLPSDGVLSP